MNVLLLAAALAWSQETASFLKIGVGARPLGMGGAYTAVADDVNSIAWNPAGLAGLRARELGLMHAELVGRTRYDFAGFAAPAPLGSFGVAARRLSQGSIDGRDDDGRPTGDFEAADTAFDVAYAARAGDSLRLGGGFKWVRSNIAEVAAQTYAFDLGGQYRLDSRVGLGVAVQNLGPGMRFLDETSRLPLTLAAGLGYRLPAGLTLALDARHRPYARKSEVSVGTEYALLSAFAVRAGYASATRQERGASPLRGVAGGFGVKVFGYSLDYSITPFGELGNAHRFSLGARF